MVLAEPLQHTFASTPPLQAAEVVMLMQMQRNDDVIFAPRKNRLTSICYANLVEYCVHRFLYHELTSLKKFRKYHAIVHHGFFSKEQWKIQTTDDIFFVLFPSW